MLLQATLASSSVVSKIQKRKNKSKSTGLRTLSHPTRNRATAAGPAHNTDAPAYLSASLHRPSAGDRRARAPTVRAGCHNDQVRAAAAAADSRIYLSKTRRRRTDRREHRYRDGRGSAGRMGHDAPPTSRRSSLMLSATAVVVDLFFISSTSRERGREARVGGR